MSKLLEQIKSLLLFCVVAFGFVSVILIPAFQVQQIEATKQLTEAVEKNTIEIQTLQDVNIQIYEEESKRFQHL